MERQQPRVIIVGAGLAGLTLAHGLAKSGIRAALYEQAEGPKARDQGYRIHLDAAAIAALQKCLPDRSFADFLALSQPLGDGFTFFDRHLSPVAFLKKRGARGKVDQSRGIGRHPLRQLLLRGLEAQTHFSRKFERCSLDREHPVTAHFEDGSEASADLLIGADGSSSSVVSALIPAASARDSGFSALIGKVRNISAADHLFPPPPFDHVGLVVGPGHLLTFLSEQDPPDANACLAAVRPELASLMDPACDFSVWSLVLDDRVLPWKEAHPPSGEEILAAARSVSVGLPEQLRELIEKTAADDAGLARLWTSPTDLAWPTNAAWTVLGDAIHSMVPLRGLGASAAMIDAQMLCETIAANSIGAPGWSRALGAYERAMRRRNRPPVRSSRWLLSAARVSQPARSIFFGGLKVAAGWLAWRNG